MARNATIRLFIRMLHVIFSTMSGDAVQMTAKVSDLVVKRQGQIYQ